MCGAPRLATAVACDRCGEEFVTPSVSGQPNTIDRTLGLLLILLSILVTIPPLQFAVMMRSMPALNDAAAVEQNIWAGSAAISVVLLWGPALMRVWLMKDSTAPSFERWRAYWRMQAIMLPLAAGMLLVGPIWL